MAGFVAGGNVLSGIGIGMCLTVRACGRLCVRVSGRVCTAIRRSSGGIVCAGAVGFSGVVGMWRFFLLNVSGESIIFFQLFARCKKTLLRCRTRRIRSCPK